MGNTPGVPSTCLFYVVNLNEDGWPIPGTMQGRNNNKITSDYRCREARLPPYQMVAPSGKRQCFAKNHLRYFYKVSKITGDILPNSLWEQVGKPRNMCSGTFSILEYKQFI